MGKLTERQRRFADEYVRLGEITQAAVNAGYSTKTAYAIGKENLEKPSIKSYVSERLDELRKESIAEQDEVLQYLTSVMRGEHKEQVLRGAGEGAQVIDDIDVAANQRIRAAELLGKRWALWTDKTQIDSNEPIKIKIDYGEGEGESDANSDG